MERAAQTWLRWALSCCSGALEDEVTPPPRRDHTTPSARAKLARYKILGDDNELIRRQLEFRAARRASRSSSRRAVLAEVAEDGEERSAWLRTAALLVLQFAIRRCTAPNTPSYLRNGYVPPAADEWARRRSNLRARFPRVADDRIDSLLSECKGHGGHVAAVLLGCGAHECEVGGDTVTDVLSD